VGLTGSALEAMITADGWPIERLDASTWCSGFTAGAGRFRFFLRLTEHWLDLTIVPFLAVPEDPSLERVLFRALLELNREITLAKLALEERDVVLTVELPTENLTWPLLKDGLDALSFYASKHHADLAALAGAGQAAASPGSPARSSPPPEREAEERP
jgi:Putative bacterial sensory transduction regulator